jgi:hypothetical protein
MSPTSYPGPRDDFVMEIPLPQERIAQARELSKRQSALLLGLVWLLTVAISIFMHRDQIATLGFGDPDDMMRLLEVRDFLAGQSWFDVTQHRANPPLGGPMHWSRLVDLPIAGVILLLRPFLGVHGAEIGAVLIVPALTLAALLYALYWAVSPLLGRERALLCCAAFAISPFVVIQCSAMRIDHHAWQGVTMALALGATLDGSVRKGGLIAGLAMAVWLHISIEGLAIAALTGAVMAFRYILNPREWSRITIYSWTLVSVSTVLLMGTQGWRVFEAGYCDSLSAVYLFPLAVLPPVMTTLQWMFGQSTTLRRLLSVVLAVGASIAVFLGVGTECLAGPFATLDPIVYKFWYMAVPEGLPIWEQRADTALIIVLPGLIGMTGYAIAAHSEKNRLQRLDWHSLFIFAIGATFLAVLVRRTGFIAHLAAMPGAALLAAILLKRARALSTALWRIPATIAPLILLFPITVIPETSAALPDNVRGNGQTKLDLPSVGLDEIASLERLAPTTVFAPIDISPSIMLHTSNAIVGTGHHRNVQGMKLVLNAFLAAPEEAQAIVARSSAEYLAVAPIGETNRYRKFAPGGLAAQLLAGKCPNWLSPVSLPGLKTLRLYRIKRPGAVQ